MINFLSVAFSDWIPGSNPERMKTPLPLLLRRERTGPKNRHKYRVYYSPEWNS